MLSGQVPFDGTTTHSILYAQVNNPPPPLREFSGLDVLPPVEAVVEKMLAKERSARYGSAGEFTRDLAQAVAGVWPAGLGGGTIVVTPQDRTEVMTSGVQPAAYTPTMAQPWGQPVQPTLPQQVPPSLPREGKKRPALMWGLIGGGAVLVLLALTVIVGVVIFGPGLFDRGKVEAPTATAGIPTATAEPPTATARIPTATAEAPTATAEILSNTAEAPAVTAAGQLVFTSERDDNAEIYLMNSDGSGQMNLTASPSADFSPQWSPDGSRIAFHSYESDDVGGNAEIYVMDADGGNWVRVTRNEASDKFPGWSPDGREFVFVSDRDGNFEIYVMGSDGSRVRRLTDDPAQDYFPAWSPVEDKILFESDRDENTEIYVMDADGSDLINLTQNAATDSLATWSPDGTRIAFTSDRSEQPEVWVMDADGGNPIRLTTEGGREPRWSPDGTRIVFVSERDGNVEIYVMNSDGSEQVRLTNSAARDWDPHWAR
jgi:Tol biopolymer transport system component